MKLIAILFEPKAQFYHFYIAGRVKVEILWQKYFCNVQYDHFDDFSSIFGICFWNFRIKYGIFWYHIHPKICSRLFRQYVDHLIVKVVDFVAFHGRFCHFFAVFLVVFTFLHILKKIISFISWFSRIFFNFLGFPRIS